MSARAEPSTPEAEPSAPTAPSAPTETGRATAAPILARFSDLEALSRAAATRVSQLGQDAVLARGVFHLALSGGSTPRRLLQLLAAAGPAALPWDRVQLWWCDERTVPPEHPDSNYGMVHRALIAPLGGSPPRAHRMAGEAEDPSQAAAAYQRQLVAALGTPPVLDLALLGLGSDGHTASLFPGSPASEEREREGEAERWVVANPVRSPLVGGQAVRLTLTAATLAAARQAIVLVAGADKADALREVLEGPRDPRRYPAQRLADSPRPVQWWIDEAAAARLTLPLADRSSGPGDFA